MKKRILAFILAICAMFGLISTASAAKIEKSASDTILSIDASDMVIDGEEVKTEGPQSFFVRDERNMYILDTVNSKVRHYTEGRLVESISIDVNCNMLDLYVVEGKYYILTEENEILQTDWKGKIQKRFDLNPYARNISLNFSGEIIDREIYPETIVVDETQLIVNYEDGAKVNIPLNESVEFVAKKSDIQRVPSTYAIEAKSNSIVLGNQKIKSDFTIADVKPVAMNRAETAVFTCELGSSINGNVTSNRVFFMNGDNVKSFVQLEEQPELVPNKMFQAKDSGHVYQMVLENGRINVIKLKEQTNYTVQPAQMQKAYKPAILEEEPIVEEQRASSGTISPMAVSVSTARQNAIDMYLYKWTYKPALNGKNKPQGVVQPKFLQGVTKDTSFTGIPYCRGGSQGKSVTYQKVTFAQALAKGYYAGNATGGNYVGNTTGLDCSGYVSVAFKLGKKYSTRSLVSNSGPFVQVTDGTIKKMDILNKAGSHVAIHADTTLSGGKTYFLIYEETTKDFLDRKVDRAVGISVLPSKIPSTYKRARIK